MFRTLFNDEFSSFRRVGGLRFLRLGRLNISWSVSRTPEAASRARRDAREAACQARREARETRTLQAINRYV